MTNQEFDEAGAEFESAPAPGPQDERPAGPDAAQTDAEAPGAAPEGPAGASPAKEAQADPTSPAASTDSAGPAASAEPADPAGLTDPLAEAMATISSLEDQVARRGADLYNLEQEYKNYVRRSKTEGAVRREEGVASVVEALLPVLDDVELARQHGDLTGPFAAIAEKFESTLASSFGVERYGKVGDAFDPLLHEALMHSTSAEAEAETIETLIQPGYRIGEKVLRPARVAVVSPE